MISLSLGDILKALDQFKAWPRIKEAPDRLDVLEARVAALEAELRNRPPKEACPYCGGALQLEAEKPHPTFGDMGVKVRVYRCTACGKTTEKERQP